MPYKDPAERTAYQRKWMRARRETWLQQNGPCRCGSWADLEVDHVDPSQKVSHRIWSWSESRRAAELAKCQVLCGDCHKAKTAQEKKARAKHGSETMYVKYKCRCDDCRRGRSERRKAERQRQAERHGSIRW